MKTAETPTSLRFAPRIADGFAPAPAAHLPTSSPLPPLSVGVLFERCKARLYRWARAHGLVHEAGLDVVQESFARMLAAAPSCPSEPAQISWLRRTASNLAIDARRAAWSRTSPLEDVHAREAGRTPHSDELAALHAAMQHLTEQQRIVLLAKSIDGLTFAEIAQELGVAIPTAKTHYVRALSTLRRYLDPAAASLTIAPPTGVHSP